MDWWHATGQKLWQGCKHLRILDYVEAVLGPDFYLWAANSSVKNQAMERLRLIGYLSPPACIGKERPHSNFILLSLIEDKTIYRAKTG